MKQTISKRIIFKLCLLLIFITCSFLPIKLQIQAETDFNRVYDYADVLSDKQEKALESLANIYYKETGYHYLIVITNTKNEYSYRSGNSSEENCELYANAFYQSFIDTYGTDNRNCTILTIDLSPNRYADISAQGNLDQVISDNACEQLFDAISSDLHSKNYFKACKKYYTKVNNYINSTNYSDEDLYDSVDYSDEDLYEDEADSDVFSFPLPFQIITALGIGGFVLVIMLFRTSAKMTVNAHIYLDNSNCRMIEEHDHYLRTSVTKTKRNTNNNKHRNNHSNAHRSSSHKSGGSHGGGHF